MAMIPMEHVGGGTFRLPDYSKVVTGTDFSSDKSEHSWTATCDCVITGYIGKESGMTAAKVQVDGAMCALIDTTASNTIEIAVFVPVLKGQVVKTRNRTASLTAYEMMS